MTGYKPCFPQTAELAARTPYTLLTIDNAIAQLVGDGLTSEAAAEKISVWITKGVPIDVALNLMRMQHAQLRAEALKKRFRPSVVRSVPTARNRAERRRLMRGGK